MSTNREDVEKDLLNDIDEEVYEIVSISGESGESIDCYILDTLVNDEQKYLLVSPCEDFDEEETEAFILKQIKEEDKEIVYIPIEDEDEYNKILIFFQENDTDYEMKF